MSAALRRLLVTALALSSTMVPRLAQAADPDPWFGRDKWLHFGVSIGLSAGGYGASTFFLDQPWQRAAAGAGFSLTLGAGKELYDLSGHGDPSWRDFTWDVAGTAVGTGLSLLVDALVSSSSDRARPSSATTQAKSPLSPRPILIRF